MDTPESGGLRREGAALQPQRRRGAACLSRGLGRRSGGAGRRGEGGEEGVRSRALAQRAPSRGGRGALPLSPCSGSAGPSAALQVRSASSRGARGCPAAGSGGHGAHFPGSAAHAADARVAGEQGLRGFSGRGSTSRIAERRKLRPRGANRVRPWEGHPAPVRAGRKLTPSCPAPRPFTFKEPAGHLSLPSPKRLADRRRARSQNCPLGPWGTRRGWLKL